ncbi:MAG: hypothetical protein C4583_13225 [Anaerolineaceae bacterium]|nr:MAG: hypothetical protein C4583_13225 [Anaerolineaceae bacterium]
MRKNFFALAVMLAVTLACAGTQPTAPATSAQNVETMVAATMQAWTVNAPPPTIIPTTPPANGPVVSFENVNFILPAEVATNALAGSVSAVNVTDGPMSVNTPEHIKFEFDGYALYGTFHEPHIIVYPAQEYAALNEGASRSIAKLQAILNGTAAPIAENLPFIASFNAGQLFAAQIQVIQFQSGSGVRFLTEYGQYFATANNHDLFYQFQGLTSDGKYYILAILPASHPLLAYDEKPETAPPSGGIPFPGYENESELTNYYTNVVNLLNSAAPENFTPALTSLDALIQSLEIH